MTDPTVFEPSYTPASFAEAERISERRLWELWKEGKGPDYYLNGRRRIIPHSARVEFQKRKLAETKGAA